MPAQDYSELNARVKYGKHDLHLGLASRPPDHTWGHGLPWVSPKRRVSGAYRLTVCVCRAYRSNLQATSTDLFFGAEDKQGRLR